MTANESIMKARMCDTKITLSGALSNRDRRLIYEDISENPKNDIFDNDYGSRYTFGRLRC